MINFTQSSFNQSGEPKKRFIKKINLFSLTYREMIGESLHFAWRTKKLFSLSIDFDQRQDERNRVSKKPSYPLIMFTLSNTIFFLSKQNKIYQKQF